MTTQIPVAHCAGHAVLDLAASLCDTPPGNRPIAVDDVKDLIESHARHGQLVPGIVFPKEENPSRFWVADGNRRLLVARITGTPFRAVALDHAPAEADLIRLRLTLDSTRKAFQKEQVAAEVWRYMQLTSCTLGEAARIFGFSQSYASKLVAPYRTGIPELLEAVQKGEVLTTAAPCVAVLSVEDQHTLLPKIKGKDGRPLSREDVELIVAEHKGGDKKVRTTRLTLPLGDGVVLTVADATVESIQAARKRLDAAMAKLLKDELPLAVLPSLLKG